MSSPSGQAPAMNTTDELRNRPPEEWELERPIGGALPVCESCGHAEVHCPSSGCNHIEDGMWCECDEAPVGET